MIMKLHHIDGHIQTILLAEYPDKLLLLDGCCRSDVAMLKLFITQNLQRPFSDLALIVVTHIPAPLEDARFRKPERVIIKAHFLLMVIPLKTNVTTNMFYSVFPEGLVYKSFMLRY
jgi:hypothetical protein